MKTRISLVPLLLAACCATGFPQTVAPSVTIGTHVLTLGMPESLVLDQLGSDLELRHLGTGKVSSWLAEKKVGSDFEIVGNVVFEGHILAGAIRYWQTDESSNKSLFYAISEVTQSLERDGLTHCQLSAAPMLSGPSAGLKIGPTSPYTGRHARRQR